MIKKGQEIYFSKDTARIFAEREENYKHKQVSSIIAKIILACLSDRNHKIKIADLGAGAHPDRYDELFELLLGTPGGVIDWVDSSPFMIELAKEYLDKKGLSDRKEVINFVPKDFSQYLEDSDDDSLDVAIMKYTFEDIIDLEPFMRLLQKKLKPNGIMVATVQSSPEITSIHSNARYLYQGKEFPENETRTLTDGEEWQIKFYRETDNPASGYLPGIETVKYYHSPETIAKLAEKFGFYCRIGDWKDIVPDSDIEIDQTVIILKKKA